MSRRLGDEGGYTLIELLVVVTILTIVLGGVVTLFVRGLNAESDQNRRYQAQQDARVALDRMRREIHGACTVSSPSTYNTAVSSVTLYFTGCAASASSVTWCTTGSSGRYALYRIVATSCTSPVAKYADYLTSGTIFTYLPPNSHLNSSTSLGTGASGMTLGDGSSTLPRLHVDLTTQLQSGLHDSYRLVDDIAFRNGPRTCGSAISC